ncbi:hypothetical protein SPI_00353 [Niveomyces insectorum RCEF 264]|uniref:Uncharacterized protein n=1 Tax=Niveomyces insectorum RCEF 264 TaxID=1081102 RepID=A0A168A2D2_9HYPO|nr:hypothetical protein SPI_00353 [Niveomyces insectorum RCEF 264]
MPYDFTAFPLHRPTTLHLCSVDVPAAGSCRHQPRSNNNTSTSASTSTNSAIMSDSAMRQWTLVLVLTALLLSLVVLGQTVARYGAAYWAAPREMAALLDSADSSLQENESYDRDVAKVPRRDDKIRLGRLLREIQRAGDDLREDLNSVLVGVEETYEGSDGGGGGGGGGGGKGGGRTRLDERLRRLDLLRMRFLVVYMSIVAATATAAAERVEKSAAVAASAAASTASAASSPPLSPRDSGHSRTASIVAASIAAAAAAAEAAAAGGTETTGAAGQRNGSPPATPHGPAAGGPGRAHPFLRSPPPTPGLPDDLADKIRQQPPLRRASTQSAKPPDASPEGNHRAGWMGVVQELQRSPLLHKRHTSIEMSMTRR